MPTGAMSIAKVIYMPEGNIPSVDTLTEMSQMSAQAFGNLRKIVQTCAKKTLDSTGRVSIEDQDPIALRRFYEQIKKHEFVSKRYPYCWPALGYLELWLRGRRGNYHIRTGESLPPVWVRYRTPIWIRFAQYMESGQSLREISDCAKLPQRSRPRIRKQMHRKPSKPSKKGTSIHVVVEDIPDSSINDTTTTANGPNVFMASIRSFLVDIISGALLMG